MDKEQSGKDARTPSEEDRLIRVAEVLRVCGLSRTQLYVRVAKGDFPAPIKIGERASAWSENAVRDWVGAKIRQGLAAHRRAAQEAR